MGICHGGCVSCSARTAARIAVPTKSYKSAPSSPHTYPISTPYLHRASRLRLPSLTSACLGPFLSGLPAQVHLLTTCPERARFLGPQGEPPAPPPPAERVKPAGSAGGTGAARPSRAVSAARRLAAADESDDGGARSAGEDEMIPCDLCGQLIAFSMFAEHEVDRECTLPCYSPPEPQLGNSDRFNIGTPRSDRFQVRDNA